MESLLLRGGAPLEGEVAIGGAKNAALPAMFACLLSGEECELSNFPRLVDIEQAAALLRALGAKCEKTPDGGGGERWRIDCGGVGSVRAPYEIVRKMRASILALGPLLARFGRAEISLPGGCAIGARPVDLHLAALAKMGASIRIEDGYIVATAGRLRGIRFRFDPPSVTGTANALCAACLATGETTIENAACEPEIVDLARLLTAMGARIEGAGEARIIVCGVDKLGGAQHAVVADRIEAGTYLALVAATGGRAFLRGARADHLEAVVAVLRAGGAAIESVDGGLRIEMRDRARAVDVETAPYPHFPTDMQAQMMAVNCAARGRARVVENIFENRFMHAAELRRMGAKIDIARNTAIVEGVFPLTGATVMATDLRASASLVIAGLAAKGETVLRRLYHLDRGYEAMEKKLAALGAQARRVSE